MRKMVLASISFGVMGIIIGILSGIRWAVTYNDKSNLLFGILIAVLMMLFGFGGAWLLSSLSKLNSNQTELEQDMASTQKTLMNVEGMVLDLKNKRGK